MKYCFFIMVCLFFLSAGPALAAKADGESAGASESNLSQASPESSEETYTVRKGDNLYRIAKKFNLSVKELKSLNHLRGNRLKTGQKLLIKTIEHAGAVAMSVEIAEEIARLASSPEVEEMGLTGKLLFFAGKMIGIPYRFGGTSFMGIDCSAFIQKVFSFAGIDLPRTAREQFLLGEPVDRDTLVEGDLVFFRTYAKYPSHVGIYLGDNFFIHASTRQRRVRIDSLDMPYYTRRFIGAKRLPEISESLKAL